MKTLTQMVRLSLAAAVFSATPVFAGSLLPQGTLHVTVVDENGKLVQDAPVYIYGEHKTHFVGGKDIPGAMTFEMAPGEYRISTAIIRHTGEYIDRFASHEAHVQVESGDNTSVILSLMPIQDPVSGMDYAEVHKIGVADDVARTF